MRLKVRGLEHELHHHPAAAPESGLTVLVLHGFLDSGATFDLVAERLAAAGHEVIAPDLRGFGDTDRVGPGGYYHFPDYVADVAALVDLLAPPRLALLGHSMGGVVASLYAGAHPGRLEKLVLLEGLGLPTFDLRLVVERMRSWLRDLARREGRPPAPLRDLDDAVARLARAHPDVPRALLLSRARLLTRPVEGGALAWKHDPLHQTTSPTPFSSAAYKEFLRAVDCPALLVRGGARGFHTDEDAERAACLADFRLAELADAGHMMHWTRPAELAALLVDFFSR